MPKIAKHKLLTFFLWGDDVQHQPPHLHMVREKGGRQMSAKIWLDTLEVEDLGSQTKTDVKQALKVLKPYQELLKVSFNKIKEGEEVIPIKLKIK
jgi:hypothetical protein